MTNTIFNLALLSLAMLANVNGASLAVRAPLNKVAVCTLPPCTTTQNLSKPARGITLTPCVPHKLERFNFAFVSIAPDSGLQQQIWDTFPQLDTYWLKKYLEPQVQCQKGFNVECWQAPASGCGWPAGSGRGKREEQAGTVGEMKLVKNQERPDVEEREGRLVEVEKEKEKNSADDDGLVPLPDASIGRK